MHEERVVAPDGEDGLLRADLVALVERADLEVVPAALPDAVLVAVAGALAQDRDRLVDPAEHRVLVLLEDLHEHLRVVVVVLEQALGEVEVGVRVVALANALDGQAEDRRGQAAALDGRHARRVIRRAARA